VLFIIVAVLSFAMTPRLLVAMDDSEMAEYALQYAFEMHPEAEISVQHVVGEPSGMMGKVMSIALEDNIQEAADKQAESVLRRANRVAEDYEKTIETIVDIGTPAKAIITRAEDFDTVIIGSHGGSFADRLFVGNVAQKVFQHSPVPVTVVR
jgi:nucleotide-binding universal stress UspA family protein